MKQLSYKIAKYYGGIGHYSEVSLNAVEVHADGVTVANGVFDWIKSEYGSDAWEWPMCDECRMGAEFAARFALDLARQGKSFPNIRITITDIRIHPAHSNALDVALATYVAVQQLISSY